MDTPVVRSGTLIRRMGGKVNNKKEPRKSGGWAKQWCTRGRTRLSDRIQSRHTDTIQRSWLWTTPMLPRHLPITSGEALHTPVYHPNKALCILDLKFISRHREDSSFLFLFFPYGRKNQMGNFLLLARSKCSELFSNHPRFPLMTMAVSAWAPCCD